ncbi:MAG: hypothetical protein KGO51_12200, partial [Alphaproteobacteria bacterium]|nr:hypothetical protein [Alphaproteobacteria bacterium]
MPLIDLSTLDGPELRRLLDSARRQGQAAQTYEILQEMEARRHRRARTRLLPPRRPGPKPHTISLALGDAPELKEKPLPTRTDDDPPLRLAEPPRRTRPRQPAPVQPKRQGWAHWGALLFAVGLAAGVAAGWWAANFANGGAAPSTSAGLAVQTAGEPAVQTAA